MSTPHAIELRKLTKNYGNNHGIFDLDLTIEPGEVFGFLGPNGAGKTTTIRTIMGSLRPSSGEAYVFGLNCVTESVQVKEHVGFLPGELPQFDALRGNEVVGYLGALRGRIDHTFVQSLCQRLDLDLARPYREYSRGNKQKLGLVVAMMHRPRLLILDEPTGGLDPLKQQTFNELVLEAKREGTTVFLSSHVLSEVEHVCQRFGMIRQGRLMTVGGLDSLRTMRSFRVTFETADNTTLLPQDLQRCDGVDSVTQQGQRFECLVQHDFGPLLKLLSQHPIYNLSSTQPTLEEMFFTYYQAEGTKAHHR